MHLRTLKEPQKHLLVHGLRSVYFEHADPSRAFIDEIHDTSYGRLRAPLPPEPISTNGPPVRRNSLHLIFLV